MNSESSKQEGLSVSIKYLNNFLKKYKYKKSFSTFSELLGYIIALHCIKKAIPVEHWLIHIMYADEDCPFFSLPPKKRNEFFKQIDALYVDTSERIKNSTIDFYFKGKDRVDLAEWCKGFFFGGNLFWIDDVEVYGQEVDERDLSPMGLKIKGINLLLSTVFLKGGPVEDRKNFMPIDISDEELYMAYPKLICVFYDYMREEASKVKKTKPKKPIPITSAKKILKDNS